MANWNEAVTSFVKVIPSDYKRVIETIEELKATGMSEEEAVQAAFEVNTGQTKNCETNKEKRFWCKEERSWEKATGFIEYAREEAQERDPLARLQDWKEFSVRLSDESLKVQGARCMDCGTPFCQMGTEIRGLTSGCPVHNLIPEWNDLVYRGRWKEALDRLLKNK
ncbi:hypothetical protein GCM10020331_062710 [Ectobacillus funiculus]